MDWRNLDCSDVLGGVGDTASEMSGQTTTIVWQEDPTQLPSSVAYETWYWLWFCGLLSLALALPGTYIKTASVGLGSAVLGHANGGVFCAC